MSPLKRKRLKVIFFLVYISASSLRPILVKPPTAADRPCDQRLRSIIRPQPIHHNRQPRARPSPHAAASLALAQRTPLAAILAAYDSGLPDKCESPALRCCAVDTSCPRAGGRNGRRGGCPRRPLLPPSSVAGRRQLAGDLQLEQGALAAINPSVAALRSEGVPIHPCEEILRADQASLSSDQIVAAL